MAGTWWVGQALEEMGAVRFYAWIDARKGSAFAHCLTPKVCERRAAQGDLGAIATLERFQVELITQRLKA